MVLFLIRKVFMKQFFLFFFIIFAYSLSADTNDDKNSPSFTDTERNWLENNTIDVGIEKAKPYIYFNKSKNDIDGLYSDIFKLVIKKSGLKVKYTQGAWSEILQNFKEKKLDLLPATFYSKKREDFGIYSDPFYHVREYIYVNSDNQTINSFEDLSNKKIAITKGYATIAKIKEKFPKIQIIETNNLVESVSMLQNNYVDALIDYHLVVETYIRDNAIIGLKSIAQSILDPISVHYLSHIDKPILHSILQKSLRAISRQEMNALLKLWVKVPYKQNLLSLTEEKYLKSNTFNIYINNWKPFTYFDKESNSYEGLSIELWKLLLKEKNINYKFIYRDGFINMLDSVKNDPNGLIISTSHTKDRSVYAMFTDPYSSYPIAIATNIKENYIIDFKELEGKTVAVGKSHTAHKLLEKYHKSINFVTVKNTQEGLDLLSQGKVFATADILPILIDTMSKYHYSDLKISGTSEYKVNLQIMVNKKSEKLAGILNKYIAIIDKEKIQAINNKWMHQTKYIESVNYSLFYKILIPIIILSIFILILYFSQKKSNSIIRKQKEELKDLNERFELTLDAAEDGLWDWNIITDDLYMSKNWAQMLGYKVSELEDKGSAFFQLIYKEDLQSVQDAIALHFQNPIKNKYAARIRLKCKDGSYKWVLSRGKVILDENKNPIRMLGFHSDISLEVEKENQLKYQEKVISEQSKLAAMGEMIGNIAHQWRQPLSVISTGATGMRMQKEFAVLTDEEFYKTCSFINENAQYLSQTIDDFRNFIKGDRTKIRLTLTKNIHDFLTLIDGSIKTNNINIILNLDDDIVLDAYPNELIQCFMNIYNNAKDAFSSNEDKYFFLSTQIIKDKVVISFKDNAGGIPKDLLGEIFNPYFTTKHQSVGTGLGLSMTHSLVAEGMNGTITAKNTSFKYENQTFNGAEFIITLPID